MRLTSFTDYGLRVLIALAVHPDEQTTIAEIASTFGISENHLMKVVHHLGKAGLLANMRGKGGGLRLAKPPHSIGLGRVVRITEGAPRPVECFDVERNRCVITPVCRARGAFADAVKAFYAVLDQYTLEDLVRNRRALAKALSGDTPRPMVRASPVQWKGQS